MSATDPELVTLLAEHKPEWRGNAEDGAVLWCCTCGEFRSRNYDEFLAHLAAVVEGRVRERIAAELDEAADDLVDSWDPDPDDARDAAWLRDRAAAHRPAAGACDCGTAWTDAPGSPHAATCPEHQPNGGCDE